MTTIEAKKDKLFNKMKYLAKKNWKLDGDFQRSCLFPPEDSSEHDIWKVCSFAFAGM